MQQGAQYREELPALPSTALRQNAGLQASQALTLVTVMQWWSQRPRVHSEKRKDRPQGRGGMFTSLFSALFSCPPPGPRGKETAACSQAPGAGGSALPRNDPKGAEGRQR